MGPFAWVLSACNSLFSENDFLKNDVTRHKEPKYLYWDEDKGGTQTMRTTGPTVPSPGTPAAARAAPGSCHQHRGQHYHHGHLRCDSHHCKHFITNHSCQLIMLMSFVGILMVFLLTWSQYCTISEMGNEMLCNCSYCPFLSWWEVLVVWLKSVLAWREPSMTLHWTTMVMIVCCFI